MFKLAFATAFLALAALAQGPTITTPVSIDCVRPPTDRPTDRICAVLDGNRMLTTFFFLLYG